MVLLFYSPDRPEVFHLSALDFEAIPLCGHVASGHMLHFVNIEASTDGSALKHLMPMAVTSFRDWNSHPHNRHLSFRFYHALKRY